MTNLCSNTESPIEKIVNLLAKKDFIGSEFWRNTIDTLKQAKNLGNFLNTCWIHQKACNGCILFFEKQNQINSGKLIFVTIKTNSLGQFFCFGLGSMFCILCLDLCLQTYVLRKMKTARFMLCLSQNITWNETWNNQV